MLKSEILFIFACYSIIYGSQLFITAVKLAFVSIVPALSSTCVIRHIKNGKRYGTQTAK